MSVYLLVIWRATRWTCVTCLHDNSKAIDYTKHLSLTKKTKLLNNHLVCYSPWLWGILRRLPVCVFNRFSAAGKNTSCNRRCIVWKPSANSSKGDKWLLKLLYLNVVAWHKVNEWFCVNSTRENCHVWTTSWSLITSRMSTTLTDTLQLRCLYLPFITLHYIVSYF